MLSYTTILHYSHLSSVRYSGDSPSTLSRFKLPRHKSSRWILWTRLQQRSSPRGLHRRSYMYIHVSCESFMNMPTSFTGYDCGIWLTRTSSALRSTLRGRLNDPSNTRYRGLFGHVNYFKTSFVLRLYPEAIPMTHPEMHNALIETINNTPTLDADQ